MTFLSFFPVEFKYERGEFEFMADSGASMTLSSDFNIMYDGTPMTKLCKG